MQKNVLEYLDISAKKFPNKVVYTDEQKEITFKQLEDYSKNIGMQIIQKTEKINTPIVVFVDRNVDSLIAFFGILYSGNFYVPIDNKMPVERIKKVLEKVNPSLILYNNNDKELFDIVKEGYKGLEINYINGIKIDDERINARRKKVLDIDPVYVIFTSGSTGTPKGIVIAHKNVIDFTDWMVNAIGFDENDVMANQAPFYFDLSVKDIYVTLKVGATMHILTRKQLMFPILLVKYLDEKNVTSLIWATSAFNLIANSKVLDSVVPKHINKIVLGGEALMARNLNIWKSKLPNAKFVNLYGPTEVTVDCTYYIIDKEYSDEEEIPIGVACENKEVLLLNENSEEVPQGTVGEICVRGTGVAKGYFNDNEKIKIYKRMENICTQLEYKEEVFKYDVIITNPPIKAGKKVILEFLINAKIHLNDGGRLWFVMRKDQGAKSIQKLLNEHYNVEIKEKDKGFYIFCCKMS